MFASSGGNIKKQKEDLCWNFYWKTEYGSGSDYLIENLVDSWRFSKSW